MSRFTFALTQRISMQSPNTEDQSTSGSRWSGRFCGLDEDWTQSPRLTYPLLHLRKKKKSLRMWHPSSQHPNRLFIQTFRERKRLISKCPSLPPIVRRQGAESSLLICFQAAMGRNDRPVMGSTISVSDCVMMCGGLRYIVTQAASLCYSPDMCY